MRYLFLAEKPSLMRDVKKCYEKHKAEVIAAIGGEIDFAAMSGHLCGNYEPNDYEEWNGVKWWEIDYPMIPRRWNIKPIDNSHSRKVLADIKQKAKNYEAFIVGTDSDTEGYGIYYNVEHYLGIQNKKALRFVEHSLTDKEILYSLLHMTDYHTDPVHKAFTESYLVRSRADWLFGMNMTCMVTVKKGSLQNIGRVKSPTIKMVYDNSMAITNFKPREYFVLMANYGSFVGTYVDENGAVIQKDRPSDFPDIPLQGKVIKKEEKSISTHAPKLYDLTAAQSEAGQRFGYSPSETLEIIQSLYEKHKVLSYPRTQCRYVSLEKAAEFPSLLEKITVFPDLAGYDITQADIERVKKDKQVVNDAEVKKESHDALLPTDKTPVLSAMTEKEVKIYKMILTRLLAQFLPKLEEKTVNLLIDHDSHLFKASGKRVINLGWRELYGTLKDRVIPDVAEGSSVTAEEILPQKKVTTPPKRLTQATLLTAMMNIANQIEDPEMRKSLADSKGIGTPATRASIIEDIIKRGYVEDKKGLYITGKGIAYIKAIEHLPIVKPEFAGMIDMEMKQVQRMELDYDKAYQNVLDKLRDSCQEVSKMKHESANKETAFVCPTCGKNLKDQKYNYTCDCGLSVPKEVCGMKLNESHIKILLSGKSTKMMRFRKKDGTRFDAKLILKENKLAFDFSSDLSCPCCNNKLNGNKAGYFCDCGFKLYKTIRGTTLTEAQIKKLMQTGELPELSFVSKVGKTFTAKLVLDKKNKRVSFEF